VPVRGALHFGLIADNFKAEMEGKIGGSWLMSSLGPLPCDFLFDLLPFESGGLLAIAAIWLISDVHV
jgi:hypothetical protein